MSIARASSRGAWLESCGTIAGSSPSPAHTVRPTLTTGPPSGWKPPPYLDYRSEWKDAATTRPDRLTTALTETLTDRAPSPAAVELHDAVIAWTRRMRDDGLSAANAIAILRGATRATLEPRVTSFALHRCAHMIVGDVTRWCLVEYFRRNGTGAWEPAVDDRVPS